MVKDIKRLLPQVVEVLKAVIKKLEESFALLFIFKNMDYKEIAKQYKPSIIKTLLIGEAPPPDGKTYFYHIPEKYSIPKSEIEDDTSLRATIFNHYFGRRPSDRNEYLKFLNCLKERGVFLIDIINENLLIKKRGQPFNQENINKLVSTNNLCDLQNRISNLVTKDTKTLFLLPTGRQYIKVLKESFSNSSFINWKNFRLDKNEANNCE